MMRRSALLIYPSGLCLSIKYWITTFRTATSTALANTDKAQIFISDLPSLSPKRYQITRRNGYVKTIPSAKIGAAFAVVSHHTNASFTSVRSSFPH